MKKTCLYEIHQASNAHFIDFHGWFMPINYKSQIQEHQAVRHTCGVFDISHMHVLDVSGPDVLQFLSYLLSNDVTLLDKYPVGKAQYTLLLNHAGYLLDDLIVYKCVNGYRLILNSATYDNNVAWFDTCSAAYNINLHYRDDLSILALQGRDAQDILIKIDPNLKNILPPLKRFASIEYNNIFYAKTGYTGESGFEIVLPHELAITLWQQILNQQVQPCGLGARDTLRLEAGYCLSGIDFDDTVYPNEANIHKFVNLDNPKRDFIGKQEYMKVLASKNTRNFIGVILQEKPILRSHMPLYQAPNLETEVGIITSGSFAPSLNYSIALARINPNVDVHNLKVKIRDKYFTLIPTNIPFFKS